jgi:hypothetical protein
VENSLPDLNKFSSWTGAFYEGLAQRFEGINNCYHVHPWGKAAYQQRFDWVGPFSEGYAPVCINRKAFHITHDGEAAYPYRYSFVNSFKNGLAVTRLHHDWFHILPNGLPAYKKMYNWVSNFDNNLALVREKTYYFTIEVKARFRYLTIDINGNPIN